MGKSLRRIFLPLLMVVSLLAAPTFGQDIPSYQTEVIEKRENILLALKCRLDQTVDETGLYSLAEKIYSEYQGQDYEDVFIRWHMPYYGDGNQTCGFTAFEDGRQSIRLILPSGDYFIKSY